MNTLTVDDNPVIVSSVQEILKRIDPEGEHRTADSGEEAIKLLEQYTPEVTFLDIEMPGINGLEVAERMKALHAQINIVFITGHAEYALSAFELYVSGFLLKPVTEGQIKKALQNLRYPLRKMRGEESRQLKVQCFGQFEVWCNGEPLNFSRNKTKELFAYLVDRKGAMCSIQQIAGALWPDVEVNESHASQLRVFVGDLQTTLTRYGFGEILLRRRGMLGIDMSRLDCDYYRYLAGGAEGMREFHGNYMSQYAFGKETLEALLNETQ
ncbi:MAG: response regulator [Lachnospiraceae bacterium]|nr:response regulator [Lachnospiraceae bacterium]